jgi:hypothetical protein
MEKSSSLALASPASRSNHRNGATSSPKPDELIVDCGLVMLNTSSGFACSHGGSGALLLVLRSGMLRGMDAEGGTVCDSERVSRTDCLPLLAAISSLMGSGRDDFIDFASRDLDFYASTRSVACSELKNEHEGSRLPVDLVYSMAWYHTHDSLTSCSANLRRLRLITYRS